MQTSYCNCWQPTVSCLLYMSSVCVTDFSTRAKLQCNWWRSQELKSNAFLKEGLMCWKSTLLFFLFILIFCLFLPFLPFCFFNIKTGKPKKLNTLVGHAEHLKAHGTPFSKLHYNSWFQTWDIFWRKFSKQMKQTHTCILHVTLYFKREKTNVYNAVRIFQCFQ